MTKLNLCNRGGRKPVNPIFLGFNRASVLHIVVNAGLVIIPRLEANLVEIDLSGNGLVRSGNVLK